MVDDDHGGPAEPGEDEVKISADERAAAEEMARALSGGAPARSDLPGLSALDAEAVGLIRTAAGRELPLGDVKARSMARFAVETARRRAAHAAQGRRRRAAWAGVAAAAALLLLLGGGRLLRPRPGLPDQLCSRSAGMLVPGPFPAGQGAAERLDRVTEDRLVALREVRLRELSGRPR